MRIKISKAQWEHIGKTAGWIKKAQWAPTNLSDRTDADSGPAYTADEEEDILLGKEENISDEQRLQEAYMEGYKVGKEDSASPMPYRQDTDSGRALATKWLDGYNDAIKGKQPSMQRTAQAARECACGSGLVRRPLYDAKSIFVAYVCDLCEKRIKSKYRDDIFTNPSYWTDEPVEEQ